MSRGRVLVLAALVYGFAVILASVPIASMLGVEARVAQVALLGIGFGGAAGASAVYAILLALRRQPGIAGISVAAPPTAPVHVLLAWVSAWLVVPIGGVGALHGSMRFVRMATDQDTLETLGPLWLCGAGLGLLVDVVYVAAGITILATLARTGRRVETALAVCAAVSALYAMLSAILTVLPWVEYFNTHGLSPIDLADITLATANGTILSVMLALLSGYARVRWRRAAGDAAAGAIAPEPPAA